MFIIDVDTPFGEMRRVLKPNGRAAVVVWRAIRESFFVSTEDQGADGSGAGKRSRMTHAPGDRRIRMVEIKPPGPSILRHHSLGIATAAILLLWVCLYSVSSPSTHLGSFFGNAIADWSGVVVMVFATKYFYEKGSAESRRAPRGPTSGFRERLRDHSLGIFLLITGIGWVVLYASLDSEAKWGQVVGNIVSEWTQIFALLLMTKRLVEVHSRESGR